MRSIRFRLTAGYSALIALIFALAGIALFIAVRRAAEQTIDTELRERLAAVGELLPDELGAADADALGEALEAQEAMGTAGVWVQVADGRGRWLHRSDAIDDPQQPAPSVPVAAQARTAQVHGAPFRILTAPAHGGVVQIGMPIGQLIDLLDKLRWALVLGGPALLLVAAIGGAWMSGRALRPVDDIARSVARIHAENLDERLPLRGTGDELDRLSALLNQMLARLASAFARVQQFTADASHELRTPVAIVRTTGEVMRASPGDADEHRAEWAQIVGQAERMSTLIDDLLLLARSDAGHASLAFEPLDLADVVRAATRDIQVLVDASGLTLTTSIAPCPMRGSPEPLRRIVMVLLDNAIKYTRAGGRITVRLRVDAVAATIEVADTGVGIPAGDLPHIFERFYRVARDRARHSGGTGLGLSIARSLAALHGGDIEARSALGEGSRFRVILPVA